MLTTNLRTTQALDPTAGVALVASDACERQRAVTAPSYLHPCTRPLAATGGSFRSSFDASWTFIVRKPMPKVALHPDRWPLHSTS